MSIIYEALKKLEKRKENYRPSASKHLFRYIFMIVIGVCLLIFFAPHMHISRTTRAVRSSPKGQKAMIKRVTLPGEDEDKEGQMGYRLQGIIYDQERPIALINGKRVAIGDNIQGARLVNISDDNVELETEQGSIYLTLE